MNGWRYCAFCREQLVPPWEAACGGCWHQLPRGLRNRLLHAWRQRIFNNGRYQEVLAEALTWSTESFRETD